MVRSGGRRSNESRGIHGSLSECEMYETTSLEGLIGFNDGTV